MKEKIPNPGLMKRIKGPRLRADMTPKVRITTYLDEDVLQKLKKLAKSGRHKYQSLLNEFLKSALSSKKSNDIQGRLARLEQAVFG